MAAVAREARVALRTVYLHFPSRAALLAAAEVAPGGSLPGFEGNPPASLRELTYRLQRAVATVAASRSGAAGSEPPAHHEAVSRALLPTLRELPPRDRRLLLNAVLLLASPTVPHLCRDELGLDPAESGQLVAWLVEMAVRGVEGRG